jgi:hypothetical protein
MRVEVTKAFRWAPDGNNVIDVEAGQIVEDRCAEVALQLRSGRDLDVPPADDTSAPAEDAPAEGTRAVEPPRDRAVRRAPRNKGA